MLEHLKLHLKGKVVIMGIGSTLHNDDGAGSLLAGRLKERLNWIIYDAGSSPENYLGKIIKDRPDNIVLIDAVDFGGSPGELREMEGEDLKTQNLFSTHNASLSLTINYLKKNLTADIIILMIQPKNIHFGEKISPEIEQVLLRLENWFCESGQEKG